MATKQAAGTVSGPVQEQSRWSKGESENNSCEASPRDSVPSPLTVGTVVAPAAPCSNEKMNGIPSWHGWGLLQVAGHPSLAARPAVLSIAPASREIFLHGLECFWRIACFS